jgi:hypothetical protein
MGGCQWMRMVQMQWYLRLTKSCRKGGCKKEDCSARVTKVRGSLYKVAGRRCGWYLPVMTPQGSNELLCLL